MNFKMKTLAVAAAMVISGAAMVISGAASAAELPATNGNSSLIFSAWDSAALKSYSLDLGTYLENFMGADNQLSGTSTANTMSADGSTTYAGTVAANGTLLDMKLVDFNLSGTNVSWNLAAGDGLGRKRALISEAGTLAAVKNSQVATINSSIGSYIGLGAAASTTAGTIALTDNSPFYANSSTWGDNLGNSGISHTSNVLGGVSNLYSVWQQSVSSPKATSAAGFGMLTANGQNVFATTYTNGADTYLKIAVTPLAAVPEADTWAMMLAGLGLMGFIARRRTQA